MTATPAQLRLLSVAPRCAADAAAPQVPIVAGVLHVSPEGEVLLLLRAATETNFGGHWALPGGNGDKGETAIEAADRECKEEIGVVPKGELKLIDVKLTPSGKVFFTFMKAVDEKFAPTLNSEHTGYVWATPDAAPSPMHPAVRGVLDSIATKLHELTAQDALPNIAMDRASVRSYDVEGRLHVALTPLSKATVNEYRGNEIPKFEELGLEPMKLYRLLRDPDELARAASTFNGIQFLRKHIPVSADDHQPWDIIGCTGTDAVFDAPFLMNSLIVWSKADIALIESGEKQELSCAYRYDADMTAGMFNGQPYDGVMRNIAGNHVASVEDGRVGPDCVVQDNAIPLGCWLI